MFHHYPPLTITTAHHYLVAPSYYGHHYHHPWFHIPPIQKPRVYRWTSTRPLLAWRRTALAPGFQPASYSSRVNITHYSPLHSPPPCFTTNPTISHPISHHELTTTTTDHIPPFTTTTTTTATFTTTITSSAAQSQRQRPWAEHGQLLLKEDLRTPVPQGHRAEPVGTRGNMGKS